MTRPIAIAALIALLQPTLNLSAHASQPVSQVQHALDLERPLVWLIAAQNQDGGWGAEAGSPPDVATTAISALALFRLGHTYSMGRHQTSTVRATEYILRAVEGTPSDEIDINPEGTLPQRKLGRHIDTFLAAQFLGEVLPTVPSGAPKQRAARALDALLKKIYRAQRADGGYASDGWAPVLSSAFATSGLSAAKRAGRIVSDQAIAKGDRYMLGNYDEKTQQFKTGESAGVGLYAVAGAAQSAVRQNAVASPAGKVAMERLSDDKFLAGFGTYGGEEHVSYMLTTEALAAVGGKEFAKWNDAIRTRLAAIQRTDGTWRGDHCITSTSFCTAASLITLAPQPKSNHRQS